MKINFFHTKYEVDTYIRTRVKNTGLEICIAMTPIAYSYLIDKGIETHNTLRYFTNDSHLNILEKGKVLIDRLR